MSDIAHASGASEEALVELVGVTEKLHDLGEQMTAASRPGTDWQDATRRRLMAVAADEGIGATARHRASATVPDTAKPPVLDDLFPKRPRGGRRLAIVAALLTGTVAISGVSAASGDALPGETLYNVKRSTERAQLALAGNELGRAQLYLEFARTRIEEAAAVTGDDAAVASALTDAESDLRSGAVLLGELAVENSDPTPLDYIDLFTNEHRWSLDELVGQLDGEAAEAGADLVELVEESAQRSVELRETLPCTDADGPSDELGPLPGECGVNNTVEGPGEQGPSMAESDTPGGIESDGGGSTGEGSGEDAPDQTEGPADGTDAKTGEPTDDATSSDAATSEPAEDQAEDEDEPGMLDELSGIVSDLLGR